MANSILAKMAVLISGDTSGLNKGIKASTKELTAFEKSAASLSNTLKTTIGAISFGFIAKQVLDVTANFQKFEAVLTNTLGSGSEAQKALSDIKDFAAKTPFSVEQLTSSFVKLANQGFKPSTDELRKLGDLASSTGKEFDQLAEAIIDAQTGEFERLKEFGIRAKKEGDQVKFTFKGVETQTKFTAQAIREYVLSLGDAEGVSGSMAAISETLGGKISNLGDAWDNFLLSVGNGTGGVLSAAVESLTAITNAAANLQDELALKAVSYGLRNFNSLADSTLDYLLKFGKTNAGTALADAIAPITSQSNQKFFENFNKNAREFNTILEKEGEEAANVATLWEFYVKKRIEAANSDKAAAKQARLDGVLAAKAQALEYFNYVNSLGIIESINLKLQDLEDKKKKAFSVGEITSFNEQIQQLRQELDVLNASAKLTDFGQKQLKNAKAGIPTRVDTEQGTGFNRTLDNAFPTTVPVPDIEPAMEALQIYTQGLINLRDQGVRSSEEMILANEQIIASEERKAAISQQVGGIFGDTVGQVLSGQQTLVQGIKSATAKLLPILLAQALAGTIAGAGKTTAPPPVIVALAAAGVAAVSALFRSATGHSGGGGGSAGGGMSATNVSRISPAPAQSSEPRDFEFTIHGNDLVALATSEANARLRLGR